MPCIRRAVARGCTFAVLATVVACSGDDGVGIDTPVGTSTLAVRLSPKNDSLGVGETRRFTAQVVGRAGVTHSTPVAWVSLNNDVATVSTSGDVTALAPGFVSIVATVGTSADTASVYVPSALMVEPNAVVTAVGEEVKFAAKKRSGAGASGNTFTWFSSNTKIATVTADGMVTAVGPGEVTLIASSGTQTGSAVVSVRTKDIASLRLAPATSSVYPKATTQLQITAYDDAGRAMALPQGAERWNTSDANVLVVDDLGTVTGKAKGSAVVTARIGSKSATASVNVLDEPVATVNVALDASTLDLGQITQAVATLKDATGSTLGGRTIAWQSSNPAISTVNALGVVTAVARGSATISAIADGKVGGAPVTVATKPIGSVAISPNPASATIGQSAQLSAVVKDAAGAALVGRSITWASSNAAVASVSSTGLVSAVGAGSSTISATADGISGQATFTSATVKTASIVISPGSPNVQVGQDVQLSATAYDAAGNVLAARVPAWSSSNPTVATVSNSGRVTGVSKGSANITAAVDGKSSSAAVAVNAPPPAPVASLTVSLSSSALNVGQSTQAAAVARDAAGNVLTGRAIAWSSAATTLATVSSTGQVAAIAAGSVSIVASSEGVNGSATLVVAIAPPQPVATVSLSATSTSMLFGQSQLIAASVRDALGNQLDGRTIAWSSSNLGVITVSPSGQVQAVGAGSSTIMATSEGKSGTISITVTAPVVPVSSVSLAAGFTSLALGQTMQVTATPKDSHGTPLAGRTITWSSSAPSVASVSQTGMVTALTAGSAVINATVEGVTGSLPITINPAGGTVATVRVALASAAINVGQSTQATATASDAGGTTVAGGTPTWASSNTSVATVSANGLVSTVAAGQATISATMAGKSGGASLSVSTIATGGSLATLPELPRSVPSATASAPSRVVRIPAGGDLQAALNAAQPGDELRLAGGATWTANYTLPSRACSAVDRWITVRTDIDDSQLPGPSARITPSFAGRLARIVSNTNEAAIRTTGPACGWRFLGLEILGSSPNTTVNYGILKLGDGGWAGGGDIQLSLDKVPQDFIVDRVYLHGTDSTNTTRCLALNSGRSAVVNSWLDNCHARGFDSQAIEGWNGPGPYLIENNFLAGAGENVMFGGSDPGIANLSPSDITIRHNHVWKDPAWKGVWTVKNLFELKHARRVLVEGNVFENNWAAAQQGMAIVLKTLSDNASAPWTQTADVTFRYNIVRNSPRGLNVQGMDYSSGGIGIPVARVRAENNLFEGIGVFNGTESGWLNLVTHNPSDIAIVHNTMVHNTSYGLSVVMDYGNGQARRLQIDDNVFTAPSGYAVFYSGGAIGSAALTQEASTTWSFARNIVGGVEDQFASKHPAESWYPTSISGIGFSNAGSGDYRLAAGSPYKGKGSAGTDPGADFDELARRTAGAKVSASGSVVAAMLRR